MGELGVDGNADHFHSPVAEFLQATVVGDDFRGADKGEVEGPEEKNHIFSTQGREGEFLDAAGGCYGLGGEIGCCSGDKYAHDDSPWLWF